MRITLFVLTILSSVAILLSTATEAFAQTDVPDAPADVAVYIYSSETLEVRWSSSDAANTTSFKIQWKSGSQQFDSSRQLTSDPASSKVPLQSTSTVERYRVTIADLSNGTEYTVRVIAVNSGGDSDPSDEVTGTPQSTFGQEREFFETEVIELFESSYPWLRETWDYIEARNIKVELITGPGGYMGRDCADIQLTLDLANCGADRVGAGRFQFDLIFIIVHELAHVYTLATGVADSPGPIAIAHLYFYDLLPARLESLSEGELVYTGCTPRELYANALSLVTLGDPAQGKGSYWRLCELMNATVQDDALAVARSVTAGDMPSWFGDTYNDAEGDPDLESV